MFPFVEGVWSDPPSSINSDIKFAPYDTCANAGAHDGAAALTYVKECAAE